MTDAAPHFGIAPFVLGMSRDTVRAAAGRPDSTEVSHDEETEAVETWFYQGGEIELEFGEAADSRLESVTSWSAGTTINGIAIIGCDIDDLPRRAAEADIRDLELTDDFADAGQCFQSEEHGLMFWAAKGMVVNMTIFPRFDDSGEEPQ
ncbi:MAG: hypothetical protein ABW032_02735, partial [Burkholderiaceae bacterium]